MVVGARRAALSISKTIIKHFWLTLNKNPPIHYFNKLEYLRPIQKHFKWIVGLLESMFIYCICTQYLVGAPFALITASIQRGMEVISLWHCWGGVEAQVSLTVAFSSSAFFWYLVSHFPLDNTPWVCWTVNLTNIIGHLTNFWCFLQCGQVPNPAVNEFSIFKKLFSRRKHEVLQNVLVNGCSDVGFQKTQWTNTSRWHCTPNHHRLWKLNTGLQATWAMSFYTLPPDSRTLVSKWNTKLALIWKEDFGPLGNSPVLLLSPGKTPLTTTVAKFLDMSMCGGSWCLDPSLSPFFVKLTQILESILLDNPHKAAVLSLVVHLFLPLNLLLTCLDTALCELLWQLMCVADPPCEGCQWLSSDNSQISSLPHDCVAYWTKLRNHFEGLGNLCRCFELISWLACHHILICWDVNWWVFVKCEPKSSQLKEPNI